MTPEPGASSSYMPIAASGDSSRNGEPGSSSARTRSRGRSLPRDTWRLRESSPPPSRTLSVRSLRSATSVRIAAALRLKVSERVSICEARTVMSGSTWPATGPGSSQPLRQAGHRAPVHALRHELLLVGPGGGELGVDLGALLEHQVGVLAERLQDRRRPLLDDDA